MTGPPVLVAGAGPVGLTAALMLARHGCPVRIVDRNAGPTDLSKAVVVWQRTIETLGPVLAPARFADEHPVLHRVALEIGDHHRVDIDFPQHAEGAPACVLIPQSATERILLERLEELGVAVERETEVTKVEAHGDRVACELTGPGGTPEAVTTPWLVACDGAHSTARHALALAFPGKTVAQRWMLADFDATATPEPDGHEMHIRSAEGITALFPIGPGRWRLIASIEGGSGESVSEHAPDAFGIEDIQAVLDGRTDLGWRVTASHWTSDFGVNERQVDAYVHGRILLAGDAAHVHSPAGGQGMNTGMQDAANAAWKIALIERGAAPAELIRTYQDERHPVGASVVSQSGALLAAAMATGAKRVARDHIAPAALSLPAVRRRMVAMLTEEAVSYRDGPLADGSGSRGGVRSGDCWPLSEGAQAELLLLGDACTAQAPDTFGGPDGFPLTVTRTERDERLAAAIGARSGALLVRPDSVVASVGERADRVLGWAETVALT